MRIDVESMISNLAIRLHRAGKIKDLYEGFDWTSRLLRMRQDFPDAPVILIKGGVLPVSLQKMFTDPKMLDIANQLGVGPDIALNAAWNLRGKMPSHEETVVPWHQDNSYWEPRVWDEQVLTVWVALVDATVENGACRCRWLLLLHSPEPAHDFLLCCRMHGDDEGWSQERQDRNSHHRDFHVNLVHRSL